MDDKSIVPEKIEEEDKENANPNSAEKLKDEEDKPKAIKKKEEEDDEPKEKKNKEDEEDEPKSKKMKEDPSNENKDDEELFLCAGNFDAAVARIKSDISGHELDCICRDCHLIEGRIRKNSIKIIAQFQLV